MLPEVEVKLVEAMLAKYGTDFDRMVADVRRNVYQWTKKQLERKLALYMEIAQDLGFLEGEGSKEGATNSSKRSRKTRGGTAKQ